jgi:hypothetical protein
MEVGPFKYDDIEEFKQRYILEKAQFFALKEEYSYYDVRTSNIDGTFIGEEFDNQIRLHVLKKQNAEFVEKLGLEELDRLAEERWKVDKQRSIEKYGEP